MSILDKRISAKTPLSVTRRSLEGIHLQIANLKSQISKYVGNHNKISNIQQNCISHTEYNSDNKHLLFEIALQIISDASKQRIDLKKATYNPKRKSSKIG